jgi:hypothetical protein
MNKLRTKSLRVTTLALLLAALSVTLSPPAFGAGRLGTLISESGFDWMAGTWVATPSQGPRIEVTYKWAIENHVVSVEYKASNGFAYSGFILYKSTEYKIVHVGADNQGGVWECNWDSDGRRAIMNFTNTTVDGRIRRGSAASSRIDADTMKVETYLMQNGQMDDEPIETMTYKRKKSAQKAAK